MATPRVGVDGRRRLTVTVTLTDEMADLMWAVAYVRNGNAAAGVSRVARTMIEEALGYCRQDVRVEAAVAVLVKQRRDAEPRPKLRLIAGGSSLPD